MSAMDMYAHELENQMSNFSVDYAEEITIHHNEPNIMRIVDMPDGVYRYRRAWCITDDGQKVIPIITASDKDGPGLLLQMLGDPYNFWQGGYLETIKMEVNGRNTAMPVHESKDPVLYMLIAHNNDPGNRSGSWKGRTEYAFNAIQRTPDIDPNRNAFNWCAENKHTKLLRLGPTAFQSLQSVRVNDGEPDQYDINYHKTKNGSKTNHVIVKAGINLPDVVIGPLNEEEMHYTRYDLPHECRNSSSLYILKYLSETIKRVDMVMGTNWFEKHREKAEKEKEEFSTHPDNDSSIYPSLDIPDTSPAQHIPGIHNNATVPQIHDSHNITGHSVPPQQSIGNTGNSETIINRPQMHQTAPNQHYPQRRNSMQTEKKAEKKLIMCHHCKAHIPEDSEFCPKCSQILLSPCEDCKNLFSIFENTCPHCGKVYQFVNNN